MAKTAYKCPSCNGVLLFDKKNDEQPISCPLCGKQNPAGSFSLVEMRRVFCPSCNIALQVSAAHKGVLTCPRCKKANEIAAYLDQPKAAEDKDKTVLSNRDSFKPAATGILKVISGGCNPSYITLQPGLNTLGRKTSTSKEGVNILLETCDAYISKKHAHIRVVLRSGQQAEYQLSDAGSTNGTRHNGEKLGKGEVIILRPGDKIQIGRTEFSFL